MAESFSHPLLGELVPKSGTGFSQFLGLKYASLKDRFSAPELFSPEVAASPIDASKFGPSVITTPIGCELEFGFIQQSLPQPDFSACELEGLNLNITIPTNNPQGKKLPVLVFIHGGGFSIGGNSWPQYDLGRLVQLSADVGQAIIGITINYRLGVFGFLTSDELRNAGYIANNGLRDQQTAFLWIKKYIGGFGGDPENITVAGESAGGVSTTIHLYSQKPQFSRAISMGGTALLLKPLPYSVHEMAYQTVLRHLGIVADTAEERVQALLKIPAVEIGERLPPGLSLFPAIDGDLIPTPPEFKVIADPESVALPGKTWCKAVLIGDNQLDASIFVRALEARPGDLAENFIASITKHLAPYPSVADALFASYGIATSMTHDDALQAILNFITDIGFLAPTLTYASGWRGKSYVYCFNEGNPWEGRFKEHASHILDVAFLFQNFNDALDVAQAQSAKNFAVDVCKFVNGVEPWDAFKPDYAVRVYGPSNQGSEAVLLQVDSKGDPRSGRRSDIFQFVGEPGLDAISTAFSMYLAGQ